jgi:hypothetical protein
MRMATLSFAVSLALSSSAVLAQPTPQAGDIDSGPSATSPPLIASPPPVGAPVLAAPAAGGPISVARDVGLAKVADDGISTKTVRAVPCSTAARETDGTTTCVGIPDRSWQSHRR